MSALNGLQATIDTLNAISKTAAPKASAQAVNRVAGRAISRSTKTVSQETGVPRKLVNQRVRLSRATMKKPKAIIRVNRGNLPAIKLGVATTQLSRKKKGGSAVLKVGKFKFPGAFIQQLKNGKWQVMRRTSKSRYPIEVVSIPLAAPLTQAFKEETTSLMQTDMPKEMGYALNNQIRLVIKK
ncbi:phage tail protein [Lelliottia sp. V89_10]|uniref:phage tail protein n=1 Tax=Lelliottia wanjuensis TaxID=3050585 RepID=UPI00249F4656|nr:MULTISPECIES: phage tail protein [unclassified Lelliottia]MDI3359774.1 phage tail protein [Lelliottia sp. V89_13]MDK9548732.1 phage tail protein [Lelliottia sp. V89_5]MDK9597364.1 phage tail protein [Lelliottia sp. V89_10]